MPLTTRVVLFLITAVWANRLSCAQLQDQFDPSEYTLSFDARLRKEVEAPIILQGRVLRVDEIGKVLPSHGDRRVATQLVKITVATELVVKGDVKSDKVAFHYFRYSNEGQLDLGRPRYLPEAGQRRLFFLKRENRILRSVGDVTDYTLPVSSACPVPGLCRSRTPGCCIAALMLVPGRALDPQSFALNLMKSVYVAEVLCSRSDAEDLLLRLTESPYAEIANEARELLSARRRR